VDDDTSRARPRTTREDILNAIRAERVRQEQLWAAPHDHGQGDCSSADVPLFVKLAVISEELGETAGTVLDALFLAALAGRCGEVARAALDGQADDMRTELVQVAAVAVAILEGLG
jgi:hypothetical protein